MKYYKIVTAVSSVITIIFIIKLLVDISEYSDKFGSNNDSLSAIIIPFVVMFALMAVIYLPAIIKNSKNTKDIQPNIPMLKKRAGSGIASGAIFSFIFAVISAETLFDILSEIMKWSTSLFIADVYNTVRADLLVIAAISFISNSICYTLLQNEHMPEGYDYSVNEEREKAIRKDIYKSAFIVLGILAAVFVLLIAILLIKF